MPSELAQLISETGLVDTHEHMPRESAWLAHPPDLLTLLFGEQAYVHADLIVAGLSPADYARAMDLSLDLDLRFALLQPAWQHVQHTGYGAATRSILRHFFELDELTPAGLAAAQSRLQSICLQPGARYRILHDEARLDHIQTDHLLPHAIPDEYDPAFFRYDLNLYPFASGTANLPELATATGVHITSIAGYRVALEALFARWAPTAIAAKSQHAYFRSLAWSPVADSIAEPLLQTSLAGMELSLQEREILGNWALGECARLAADHNLPLKIHTGYKAGYGAVEFPPTRAALLTPLIMHHPQTRFVLMHISWPYQEELLAMVKHIPNVWVDLCWAWSINPVSTSEFLRKFIHTAPSNKLFVFGGDAFNPLGAWAYAQQARQWLTRTLEHEVTTGLLTEPAAIHLAHCLMRENQYACFDLRKPVSD